MKQRIVRIAVDESFRKAMRIKSAYRGKKMVDFSRDLAKQWLNNEEFGENRKNEKEFKFGF